MEPYYVALKLPGLSDTEEFVIIQAFTPNNRDNLTAWLAGLADGENYGQLVAYRFPKDELVFGPLQVEGRIDQHPEIAAQLSLWSRAGSEVIRGNLLVLPVGNILLYVEPLYLRAANGQIPELKRVILVSGDRIVMAETLAAGLQALLGRPDSLQEGVNRDPDEEDSTVELTPAEAEVTGHLALNTRIGN